jgi:hypothetical protein
LTDHQLRVLLIEQANKPAPDRWALSESVLKRDLGPNVDDPALRALAIKCA